MKVIYFVQNDAPITMLHTKISCNHHVFSYKHFFAQKMAREMRSKNLWLMYVLESHCRPTVNMTSLKLIWNERPIQAIFRF